MPCAYLKYVDSVPETLDFKLSVSTPIGGTMIDEFVCNSYVISIEVRELIAYQILLEIQDFDVILGMD